MGSGSLKGQYFRYVSATVASLLVFSLYSMVDGFFVANGVGEYAMAAVNLCFPFLNVLFSVCLLFAIGASTLLSVYLGQGKAKSANALFTQNLLVLAVIGLLLGATLGGRSIWFAPVVSEAACLVLSLILTKTLGTAVTAAHPASDGSCQGNAP